MGMEEEAGRVEYHYGFYGAVHVEYEPSGVDMEYLQEHELGDKPVRLDMLLLKKESVPLVDPIGSFFRIHNVLDYKSPEDGLTIDDFYKAQGYALIYKSLGKTVNAIPLHELTVSIFRHAFPREMLKMLEESGLKVKETYPGIYKIIGSLNVPTQVIVTNRLPKGEYEAFKALTENADKDDILKLLGMIENTSDPKMAEYVSEVLHVSIAVNEGLFNEIKEAGIMTEAVERVFKKEFDQTRKETEDQIIVNMLRENVAVDKIVLYTKATVERIAAVAKAAGISSLVL